MKHVKPTGGCRMCGDCTVEGEHRYHNCSHTAAARRAQRRLIADWWEELCSEIPDGITPLVAAVSVECLDADGNLTLINMTSDGLPPWKALGMFLSASDDMRARLNSYASEDDD